MLLKIIKMLVRYYKYKRNNVTIKFNSYVDSKTFIGDYTYIGYRCMITRASIGRYVSIANNVFIGMGEHNLQGISTSTLFCENDGEDTSLTRDPVVIEDDVWIGVNVVILRGVTIGRGAVIGAGAVVTKDVPPYSIVVGVPGKVLHKRFDNGTIDKIQNSKWWEQDVDEAKRIMQNIYKEINE